MVQGSCYPECYPEEQGNGAAREIRTPDPLITNEVLYQLSYCGVGSESRLTCRMQPSGLLADLGTVASERARPSPAAVAGPLPG